MSIAMPVNPHTRLYNITEGEFLDAVAATEDVPLTREDGTLTRAGQEYVADMRTNGHADCEECHPEHVADDPFDALETSFKARIARGHMMREGHALTGYYVTTDGISKLIRTCGCES